MQLLSLSFADDKHDIAQIKKEEQMKLVTFTHQGTTRVGVVVEDTVTDLAAAAPELPREMIAFL